MPYQWVEDDGGLPYGVTQLGRSQAVSGRRYVMYHGTTRQAARSIQATGFRRSTGGMLGDGIYLSRDLDKASRYPIGHPKSDKVVIKVVVNVGRVIAIRYQGHPRQMTWHDFRYGKVFDTAWVPPNCGMVPSGLEEDCVWDPDRIQIIKIIKPRQTSNNPRQTSNNPSEDFSLAIVFGVAAAIRLLSRDLEKARRCPIDHPDYDRVVLKVVVNVGKVIAINRQGHPRQMTWHDSRYGEVFDTAWVPPNCGMVKSGLEEDCVWDPDRIKIISAIKPSANQSPSPAQAFGGCGARRYM
ncbi:uncharacterized protein LKV04_018481 [Tautogolabrus adspersus]